MEKIISVKEYAEITGLSKKTVYKRISTGQIKTIKKTDETGKQIYYVVIADPEEPKTAATQETQPGNESTLDTGSNDPYMMLLAEKDKQITQLQKQLEDLTELLKNSQKIQAGQLRLLNAAGLDPEENITVSVDPAQEPRPVDNTRQEKGHFWQWLTGKK